MPLTSTTSTTVLVSGTDASGNQVNQQFNAPPVINTGMLNPGVSGITLVTGSNTFSTGAASYGFKTVTIVPPANNLVTINLGTSSAGQPVSPGQPFTFGISGITAIEIFCGTTAGLICQLIYG